MSGKSFDDLINGTATDVVDTVEVVEKSSLPKNPRKKAIEPKAVTAATMVVVVEPEISEPLVVDAPVEDPDYALYYYKGTPKNFSAAGLWFAFAYSILAWPTLWIANEIAVALLSANVAVPKLTFFLYVALGAIAAVAVVCALVGFFTSRKRGQSFVPGIWAILLTAGTAVGTWLLFV